MYRGFFAFAVLTACAGGQSGTDQSDLDRKIVHTADAGTRPVPEAADAGDGPSGDIDGPSDTGGANSSPAPLPDCATTAIDLTQLQYGSSRGESARWPFSACVVAPNYAPLNGGDVDLTLSGVVRETAALAIEEWIPEQGCSRDDPNLLLLGEPLEPYAGIEDVRLGSVLRFRTDDDYPVELVLAAPEYCFGRDPTLEAAQPRGECPLWSYRVAAGKRVTLTISSSGTGLVTNVTIELESEEGQRELWLQQAPEATGLVLPGAFEATLGEAECTTTSECGEPVDQHEIDIVIDGEPTSLGSGASLVVDDYFLLNAGTTTAQSGSCSAATTSSIALSWPACSEVVQRVDGGLESVGYRSCAGDYPTSQYFVSGRPNSCVATINADYATPCESDNDCGGVTCDVYCQRPSPCVKDADCSPGEICLCQGMYGDDGNGSFSGNFCVQAECDSESDCNGLPCAVGYDGFWAGTLEGVFCHTPEDECRAASDCPGNYYCRYRREESRWVCEGVSQP